MLKEFHPLADVFPLIDGVEFEALASDIKEYGLREPITLHPDGTILDGRNRYRACIEAGVEPLFIPWDKQSSITAFILSKNLVRRHLNESQRAMVAAKLATYLQGGDRKSKIKPPIDGLKINEASQLLNVGERSVQRANKILDIGTDEVRQGVETGKITLWAAEKLLPCRERVVKVLKKGKQKQYAALWRQLRDSLENINGLPDTATLVNAVPAAQRDLVTRRVPVVIAWLKAFEESWNTKLEGQQNEEARNQDDHDNPETGYRTSRSEQKQPANHTGAR